MASQFWRRLDDATETTARLVSLPVALLAGVAQANRLMHDYRRELAATGAPLAPRRQEDLARKVFGDLLRP
jgi:hypothetical protein